MLTFRVRLAAVILLFFIPWFWCFLTNQNLFLYSNYPMFSSDMRSGAFTTYDLYAVKSDGSESIVKNKFIIYPFQSIRMEKLFESIKKEPADFESKYIQNLMAYYMMKFRTSFGEFGPNRPVSLVLKESKRKVDRENKILKIEESKIIGKIEINYE